MSTILFHSQLKQMAYLHMASNDKGLGYEASIISRTLSSVAMRDLGAGSAETRKKTILNKLSQLILERKTKYKINQQKRCHNKMLFFIRASKEKDCVISFHIDNIWGEKSCRTKHKTQNNYCKYAARQ